MYGKVLLTEFEQHFILEWLTFPYNRKEKMCLQMAVSDRGGEKGKEEKGCEEDNEELKPLCVVTRKGVFNQATTGCSGPAPSQHWLTAMARLFEMMGLEIKCSLSLLILDSRRVFVENPGTEGAGIRLQNTSRIQSNAI